MFAFPSRWQSHGRVIFWVYVILSNLFQGLRLRAQHLTSKSACQCPAWTDTWGSPKLQGILVAMPAPNTTRQVGMETEMGDDRTASSLEPGVGPAGLPVRVKPPPSSRSTRKPHRLHSDVASPTPTPFPAAPNTRGKGGMANSECQQPRGLHSPRCRKRRRHARRLPHAPH